MSDLIPVEVDTPRVAESSAFTRRQRDAALQAETERLVAWTRELLDDTPDVIDSEAIRDRRTEAAGAVLDVLWSVMAEFNRQTGQPPPVPGLITHLEQRRLRRSSAS